MKVKNYLLQSCFSSGIEVSNRDTGITIEPVGFSKKDFYDTSPLIEEIKKTGIEIPIGN